MTKSVDNPVRAIAFYLPQFHPILENDEWWGKGFTEWTNVIKAKPLFPGHYQPRLPADFGFYDLRVPEVREQQAEMARSHGIEGFCYWHYWFHGRRLLERPLKEILASGRPDFPFCIGWANESWTRRWTGDENEILLKQSYSPEDDLAHAQYLAAVFADARYIKVHGRPLFILYRAPALPDAQRTTDAIRSECLRLGIPEPYIVGRDTHSPGVDMRQFGCDITESSAPRMELLPGAFAPPGRLADWRRNIRLGVWRGDLKIFDYQEACRLGEDARPAHPHIPGVFVDWDNASRRGRQAIILKGSTPEHFAAALRAAIVKVLPKPPGERIVTINAWNEWGEGMYLEPDQKWGRGFLEAVKTELASLASRQQPDNPVELQP
jgi:hypothetical protein